jgi:phosphinothricin acetyltransferase
MPKGYWIARVDVDDLQRYRDEYVQANAAVFARHGARFLVRGGRFVAPEGSSRSRQVVLEFPSHEAALACYHSPEYQRLVQVRSAFSRCDLVIVEGHDGPPPQAPAPAPASASASAPVDPVPGALAIREATEADAPAIAALYNPYVAETTITFEEVAVSAEQMATRVRDVQQAGLPWLVLEEGGALRGYAYATRWKPRSAYRFSVESSVYLATGHTGRGHGRRLYGALFEALRARGVHAVIGGIALPNPASVALHERMGMAPVAQFREVGFKFGRWIDVGYWERLL